jgi:hypothetical protein
LWEAVLMKKVGIAAFAAVCLLGANAPGANAAQVYTGPCAIQQNLFQKENIQIDMYSPIVSGAYGAVCRVTG